MALALSMTTELAAGAVKSAGIEPKQMSTGLVRKSAMLAWKTTPVDDAIALL